jgi:CSLREA domain-containing protein
MKRKLLCLIVAALMLSLAITARAVAGQGSASSPKTPAALTAYRPDQDGTEIEVDTAEDEMEEDGDCSLREAIEAANTDSDVDECPAGDGADEIILPPAIFELTIAGTGEDDNATGDLDILDDLTITGDVEAASIIDGGGIDRVLDIAPGVSVDIWFVYITGGNTTGSGGGIYNKGLLTLTVVNLMENHAGSLGGGLYNGIAGEATILVSDVYSNTAGYGGGIFNAGSLSLDTSNVLVNVASSSGGGIRSENGTVSITTTLIADNQSFADGGGVMNMDSSMHMVDSTVRGNTSSEGAGIRNTTYAASSFLIIDHSQILSNTVTGGFGGGGIENTAYMSYTAALTITNSIISFNVANGVSGVPGTGAGGGILNAAMLGSTQGTAKTYIANTTLSQNKAVNGGGIANAFPLVTGQDLIVDIYNSTVDHNTTFSGTGNQLGNGGGLLNMNGTMTVVNSTISGNAATGIPGSATDASGLGGALLNVGSTHVSVANLVNTTVAGNYATAAGGGLTTAILDVAAAGTYTSLKNNIVTGNSVYAGANNCSSQPGTVPNMFVSLGFNLENGNSCNLVPANGDMLDTNPVLGALADNGGDTWTHGLLAGSPAIDAIPLASCTLPVDQRGVVRPQGPACDIGAYEAEGNLIYLPLVMK